MVTPIAIVTAIGCIAVAFVISFFTTPLAIFISRRTRALDIPSDDRRMHSAPVPRLGGIAIFLSFLICTLLLRVMISEGLIVDPDASVLLEKLQAVLQGQVALFQQRGDLLQAAEGRFVVQLLFHVISPIRSRRRSRPAA